MLHLSSHEMSYMHQEIEHNYLLVIVIITCYVQQKKLVEAQPWTLEFVIYSYP